MNGFLSSAKSPSMVLYRYDIKTNEKKRIYLRLIFRLLYKLEVVEIFSVAIIPSNADLWNTY